MYCVAYDLEVCGVCGVCIVWLMISRCVVCEACL